MKYLLNGDIEIVFAHKPSVHPHSHEMLEFAYVTGGKAKSIIKDKEAIIKKGDFFIIDYDTVHSYESLNGEETLITNVLFRPKLIDKSLAYCRSFSTFLSHYLISIDSRKLNGPPANEIFTDSDGAVKKLVDVLVKEYEEKRLGFTEIMRSVLIEILITVMRKIGSENAETLEGFVKTEVENNYVCPPTLKQIADRFNYSVPYVSAKLKKLLGVGYREYVTDVRINQARRLLANTDKKIADVAESVGYTDVNFFYELFRRAEGTSPSEFRKNLKS